MTEYDWSLRPFFTFLLWRHCVSDGTEASFSASVYIINNLAWISFRCSRSQLTNPSVLPRTCQDIYFTQSALFRSIQCGTALLYRTGPLCAVDWGYRGGAHYGYPNPVGCSWCYWAAILIISIIYPEDKTQSLYENICQRNPSLNILSGDEQKLCHSTLCQPYIETRYSINVCLFSDRKPHSKAP